MISKKCLTMRNNNQDLIHATKDPYLIAPDREEERQHESKHETLL